MNVLEIEKLGFAYGKNRILKDVSLFVKKGSLTAILAPNGTGKTTLFRTILGILKPLDGKIFVQGEDVCSMSAPKRAALVSYVPQEYSGAFNYAAKDMIMMGLTHRLGVFGTPKPQDAEAVLKLMEEMGIGDLKNRGIAEISGGQRQMILLARAFMQDCPLLLLDEPTSHLDVKNRARFFAELKKRVREKSLSVLINVHEPNLVCAHCDAVHMMKDGRNFSSGSIEETMTSENLSELYGMEMRVENVGGRRFVRED